MLKNYLIIAIRNLKRHKLYSAINICGLAVGMACCFLILLFVASELSYDRQSPNAVRLFRVVERESALTPPVLAPTMQAHLPGIASVTRLMRDYPGLVKNGGLQRYESRVYRADANVFQVFGWPLLKGDSETALSDPHTVVLTEAMARTYFGDAEPMGQTLRLDGRDFRVTGVLKQLQAQSHIHPDFLVSSADLSGPTVTQWFFNMAYTYVVLDAHVDPVEVASRFPDLIARYGDRDAPREFALQRVTDIHLHSKLAEEAEANGDVRYLYIFGSISVLILLIACINFVNLSTARSAYRAREVGARKMLGAKRGQLIGQFLGESVVVSLLAFAVAVSLFELLLPVFNALFDTSLSAVLLGREWMLIGGAGIALLIGVAAGAYSAFWLSSFSPIQAIRSTLAPGTVNAALRRGLVTVQFVISSGLMVCTAIVYFQLRYIQTKNLGFDKDQVVEISGARVLKPSRFEAFCNALLAHPDILLTSSGSAPGVEGNKYTYAREDGSRIVVDQYLVGYDYFKTMGIHLISGRVFSRDHATDKDAVIVNQTYLDAMKDGGQTQIIGVVKDFNTLSLHQKIRPLKIHLKSDYHENVLVRIGQGNVRETVAFIEKTWKQFVPDRPFVYAFLDDSLDRLYRSEQKLGRIFGAFAGVAIFVACLGLFGLAAFTAERRTKEIGVRKVLGASVSGIVLLLSKDFAKPVFVANLIAWPIAYEAMQYWLRNFAYRIDPGWSVFALSGGVAFVVALLTVGYQAWKAARANPVDALRYE